MNQVKRYTGLLYTLETRTEMKIQKLFEVECFTETHGDRRVSRLQPPYLWPFNKLLVILYLQHKSNNALNCVSSGLHNYY